MFSLKFLFVLVAFNHFFFSNLYDTKKIRNMAAPPASDDQNIICIDMQSDEPASTAESPIDLSQQFTTPEKQIQKQLKQVYDLSRDSAAATYEWMRCVRYFVVVYVRVYFVFMFIVCVNSIFAVVRNQQLPVKFSVMRANQFKTHCSTTSSFKTCQVCV